MSHRLAHVCVLALMIAALVPVPGPGAQVFGTDVTYTTDADFDLGTLVSVNHDAPNNDQLQLDSPTEPFPFINVAASGRGTVVRINTETGMPVGEYRTAPEGSYGLDPSRTTVDLFGNVWTANRGEVGEIEGVPHGSAVKIGLIVGGTRVDQNGTADPDGGYLAPPFGYNTCVDRNNDGLIRTSMGLFDVLQWVDVTDGSGGDDGLVEDAEDECILIFQRLPNAEQARHVSVDADNNVWVGGFPFELRYFHKLSGTDGAILDSFDANTVGCGGYGGLVDGNGVLWSIGWGWGEGPLLRYDPATGQGTCVNTFGGYGLGIDTNGYVWASLWENGVAKVSPGGVLEPGFPKSTSPSSSTPTATANPLVLPLAPELAVFALQAEPPAETPTFWVAPADEWVSSMSPWTPGATISLTIEDGSDVVYADSQTADSDGNFHFGFWDVFDLQPAHVVTVSDGTTTKTHTVTSLAVDGINVTADTVFGRADPGSSVDVWVHGDGNVTAMTDGSGNWTADFAGITDLTYLSDGGSAQYDNDGDGTGVWWAAPRFQVSPDDDWVQSSGTWPAGATISLTVAAGTGDVYSDSQTADSNGHFNFGDLGGFDLQRGHVVTVSDGTNTKTHTVIDLYVDGVDVTADTVFGRADPGSSVDVWVHGDGNVTTTADDSGNWVADFSGMADLTYRSDGGSQQSDEDGDSTGVWWASPAIQVQPNQDWIGSWTRWPANTAITLTIDDDADPGNGILYSRSVTTNQWGDFGLGLQGVFDVQRGQYVTATDGTTTKTHQVLDLYITGLDADNDIVSGTAAPNSEVEVQVPAPDRVWRSVTADVSGNWSADFATVTGQGEGTADLRFTSDVNAHQFDNQGDVTWVDRRVPAFRVNPDQDRVWGGAWPANSPVTVTVGSSVWSGTTNQWGDFDTGLEVDLMPNQMVTVTSGVWTKTHAITNVDVTDIDPAADQVHGTANPGAEVEVSAYRFQDGSFRWVVADASGTWSADFSIAAQDQPAFDITDATPVEVAEFDDDADATQRRFGPPVQANRGVAVTPIDNHVWVANSWVGTVTRLDNAGNVLKTIPTGVEPTGVAVDAAGKVWVTNLGSDNTVRIDPNAGPDALGAVDMTVDLGPGAGPYNYSDMTGAVVVGSTSPQGFWTVIQDSGQAGFEWGRIAWNGEPEGEEPPGTEIVVEYRTADSEAGLGGETFAQVGNGELFSSFARFIEVRVTLKASADGVSPVLSDIRVQPALIYVDLDIKPGSDPNSINIKRSTGVVPLAVLGRDDFDVTSLDVTTLRFGRGMAEPAHDLLDPDVYADHMQDVNEDGFMDLVSHYRIGDIGLMSGDTEACLVGATLTGIPIEGCDAVRIIGKN